MAADLMKDSIMDEKWDGAAAEAAVGFLAQQVSEHKAAVCRPFIERLFAAWQDGHSFIEVNRQEAAMLETAAPIVGRQGDTPLQLWRGKLFLGRMWQLENDLAGQLLRLAAAPVAPYDTATAAARLAQWFPDETSRTQQEAAALALIKPLMLITGGPGTGKTTTVARLLALLCEQSDRLPRIELAAPTGKAAAHMARSLHQSVTKFDVPKNVLAHLQTLEGKTVHRLLKQRPPQMLPQFDDKRPLALDILVVDEASMLDLPLLLSLLRAVPDGCRVILLGDENQLPSVGAGAVLSALAQPTALDAETAAAWQRLLPDADIGRFQTASAAPLSGNVMRLLFSHRFGADSGVGCLARAVGAGDADKAWEQFAAFPHELSARQNTLNEQVSAFYGAQKAYWQAVDGGDAQAAFARQSDIVMLAARRQDADDFNAAYRRHLQKVRGVAADRRWFAGQIIMVEQNHYPLSVFNGDIGLVLPDESGQLSAYFQDAGGLRRLALSRLPACRDAFAITVHKSQGSEYGEVWLSAPDGFSDGLNRALLYTAVTRARQRFVFQGSEAVFRQACANNETRRTALREMLSELSGRAARNTTPPPASAPSAD